MSDRRRNFFDPFCFEPVNPPPLLKVQKAPRRGGLLAPNSIVLSGRLVGWTTVMATYTVFMRRTWASLFDPLHASAVKGLRGHR